MLLIEIVVKDLKNTTGKGFWWMGRKAVAGNHKHDLWVEGCEPICAGLISGAALIGIGNALVNAFVP